MEFINHIELCGVVGAVKMQDISGSRVSTFSLVTEYVYNGSDNCRTIETTWFNVIAWEKDTLRNMDGLVKGCHVHVHGRLRVRRVLNATGETIAIPEVMAQLISIEP